MAAVQIALDAREGALLDSDHQRIAGCLPSRRNSDRCRRQQTDARPTELALGMDCSGHRNNTHFCRQPCYVYCVASYLSPSMLRLTAY